MNGFTVVTLQFRELFVEEPPPLSTTVFTIEYVPYGRGNVCVTVVPVAVELSGPKVQPTLAIVPSGSDVTAERVTVRSVMLDTLGQLTVGGVFLAGAV
jgi:hypothetical protein